MPGLTEEEKKILMKAYEIKERIKAEELEAGEITVEEAAEKEQFAPRKRVQKNTEEIPGAVRAVRAENNRNVQSTFQRDAQREAPKSVQKPAEQKKDYVEENFSKKEINRAVRAEKRDEKLQKKQLRQQNRVRKAEKKAGKPRKKKSFLRRLFKFLIILLIIIGLLLAGTYAFLRKTISMSNYKQYETQYVRADDVLHEKGVTNILLIGTDNRIAGSDDSRSDAMIVLSINSKKHRIVMTSILRDSYVTIPGYRNDRINEAYSLGGPALLIQTIEQNYKLGIDYYAQVDFFNFVDVIDAFGGIDINITAEEVIYIDGYISEYNGLVGDPDGTDQIALGTSGEYTLTGRQALAYSRIRKIGTDFARTERQRTVMKALISKAKHSSPFTIYKAIEAVIPDLTTNISDSKMCGLVMKSPIYMTYDMQQARVPADGTWSNALTETGQEVLQVDFGANKAYLQATIYD